MKMTCFNIRNTDLPIRTNRLWEGYPSLASLRHWRYRRANITRMSSSATRSFRFPPHRKL